jgi:ribonuclease Z
MRPSFHPRLINGPFSDPGLFIPFLFEKRALLFDLGDLHALSSRDLLKVTHGFVTHTHMDHFIGFDTLLRIFLGREKDIHLFGPPGFLGHVEGKSAGYTWNLVDEYPTNFGMKVTEVHKETMLTKTYLCRDRFRSESLPEVVPFTGILLKEPSFHVEAVFLDHRTPCIGLCLVENFSVNIIKEALREMDLSVGPWLNRFKRALYEQQDPRSEFLVTWEEKGKVIREKRFVLGDLAEKIGRISPGQKIAYVTDIVGSHDNCEKVIHLAGEADHLFIEAAFLDRDRDVAKRKYHLTAKEAGDLARKARVKQFTLFHFSPRYYGREADIKREALEAFNQGER